MRSLFVSSLVLASGAFAQDVISPKHFAATEGSTYDYQVLGSPSTPGRYLQVHDDLKGTPRTISSLAVRRDGAQTQAFAAGNVLVDIYVSTATTTASTVDKTFDNNHGTDKVKVAAFKFIQFPATTSGVVPRPFEYAFPFSQPFSFGGANGFCWEVQVSSRTNSSYYYFDYSSGVNSNPYAAVYNKGTGCKATGYTTGMNINPSSSPNWPQNSITLSYSGNYMPKNSLIYLMIGASDTAFGSLTLPFLLPNTTTAPSGPCNVYCDWLVGVPSLTNANGAISQNLGAPVTTAMNGVFIYTQAVAPDAAANSWGVALSDMVEHQIVAPWTALPVGNVYLDGAAGATGTVRGGAGYITKFN